MNPKIIKETEYIIRTLDPIDLISQGAPQNEYDDEAGIIARKLKDQPSEHELKFFVADLFDKRFGEQIPSQAFTTLITKLLEIQL
jgi:hypothetical protein